MSAMLKQKLIDIANGFTKYGLWKGGGSGGSSALSDMVDVTFTNLQSNDILKYNGSVWVNDDNLHEYSTEEKIVGKWIDGRNIYMKVIEYTVKLPSNTWVEIPEEIENKQIIFSACGFSNDGIYVPLISNVDSRVATKVRLYNFRNGSITIDYSIIEYIRNE